MISGVRIFVVLVVTAPGISGCAGANTRFYTLDAASAPAGILSAYAGPSLRVDAVHVPPALDRFELVEETSGGRLIVSDNDHWVAPVGELLRRALTQDLAARLPAGKMVYPDAPKPLGASGIVVDILTFAPTSEGMVMDVSWTILSSPTPSGAGRRPEAAYQRTIRLTTPSAGAGVSGNAAELSALAGQLSRAIVAGLDRSGS